MRATCLPLAQPSAAMEYSRKEFSKELGHGRMVWMFFKTMLHSWDDGYFLEDQGYWGEAEV